MILLSKVVKPDSQRYNWNLYLEDVVVSKYLIVIIPLCFQVVRYEHICKEIVVFYLNVPKEMLIDIFRTKEDYFLKKGHRSFQCGITNEVIVYRVMMYANPLLL